MLPKQIFKLKKVNKKPHPRPIVEVVFHIFITASVTVFPTPVALMRLEKKCWKTSVSCITFMLLSLNKSILFFQVGLEPVAVDDPFQWALDQAPSFLILGGARRGSVNARGCFRADFEWLWKSELH